IVDISCKSEIRSTKFETNPKSEYQMTKTPADSGKARFYYPDFGIQGLFISWGMLRADFKFITLITNDQNMNGS
ncbi:MAG: hypothetical protein ACLFR9_09610, partial [Desulfobacterales bacterium]